MSTNTVNLKVLVCALIAMAPNALLVHEFNVSTLQAGQRLRDFQQGEVDGLVRAKHLARGDPEGQGIANLTGRAGDGDIHSLLHDGLHER